jgi:hypothetical protein
MKHVLSVIIIGFAGIAAVMAAGTVALTGLSSSAQATPVSLPTLTPVPLPPVKTTRPVLPAFRAPLTTQSLLINLPDSVSVASLKPAPSVAIKSIATIGMLNTL